MSFNGNETMRYWWVLLLGFMPLCELEAADELFRFQSNAPIQKFSMPFFNEFGVQTWLCTGGEVRYGVDGRFQVSNLTLMLFNPRDKASVDVLIRSEDAIVSPAMHQVTGESLLTVTHAHYVLVGEQWVWEEKDAEALCSKIHIGKKASVIFYEGTRSRTSISSDRMVLLRFIDRNEFQFEGHVVIKSDRFYGSCERMWVCSQSEDQARLQYLFPRWCYIQPPTKVPVRLFCWALQVQHSFEVLEHIGKIKLIIARQHVFLQVEDPKTGEIRKANSQKAVIEPTLGELVLTGDVVVNCSQQGTFRGEKVTFYKESERVLVEKAKQSKRSRVILD